MAALSEAGEGATGTARRKAVEPQRFRYLRGPPLRLNANGNWGAAVDDATYVIFAEKSARTRVRERLRAVVDDAVQWRERKSFSGSEFFISGPPARAREAHAAMMLWMVKGSFEPR